VAAGEALATVGTDADELAMLRTVLDMDGVGDGGTWGGGREAARPRAVTDAQQQQHVKVVLYMVQVDALEGAIKKTGRANRGEAIGIICQAFLDRDWMPEEGE
jgi:hypothetical protein